jgi:hypothetical protein
MMRTTVPSMLNRDNINDIGLIGLHEHCPLSAPD